MAIARTDEIASARFAAVLNYVEEHLDGELSLADLASLVSLSVTHFAHQFRIMYGMAPYRYVMLRRIERARRLLRTTESTITSIACEVGFSSQSRFTGAFARVVGCTPSMYRTSLRIGAHQARNSDRHDQVLFRTGNLLVFSVPR